MLMIVLRFAHVVSGALWVGMFAFMTFFLMPAFAEAGPDGAKVQAALAKRRIAVIMPLIALITLVSGMWLFQRLSGGAAGAFLKTPVGLAFGLGGLAALLAFLVGIGLGRRGIAARRVTDRSAVDDGRDAAPQGPVGSPEPRGHGAAAVRARRDGGGALLVSSHGSKRSFSRKNRFSAAAKIAATAWRSLCDSAPPPGPLHWPPLSM